MEKNDEDIYLSLVTVSRRQKIFKERREAYRMKFCEGRSKDGNSNNDYMKESYIYKERAKSYITQFYEENIGGK